MKYWKNMMIYDTETNSVRQDLVEVEGSEIEYHVDRMNELAKRQSNLNGTFFRGGMRHHMGEIEKLLKTDETKENNHE